MFAGIVKMIDNKEGIIDNWFKIFDKSTPIYSKMNNNICEVHTALPPIVYNIYPVVLTYGLCIYEVAWIRSQITKLQLPHYGKLIFIHSISPTPTHLTCWRCFIGYLPW